MRTTSPTTGSSGPTSGRRGEGPPLWRRVALTAVPVSLVLAASSGVVATTPTVAAAATFHSVTFHCLGIVEKFGVPTGVSQLSVAVDGAAGGGERAGAGQRVLARVAVTPGQEILVKAGCRPRGGHHGTGGFGFTTGGAAGKLHESSSLHFGGGGSSAIGTGTNYLDMAPLVVAGGGGGAGGENPGALAARGGRGGIGGFPGVNNNGSAGGGTNGAAGGVGFVNSPAGGAGGDAADVFGKPGGGGGGGYPRGGSGGQAAVYPGAGGGGAGGESWWKPGVVSGVSGRPSGPIAQGSVTISWTGPEAPTLVARCSSQDVTYDVPSWANAVSVIAIGSSGGGEYRSQPGRGTGFMAKVRVAGGSRLTVAAGCPGGAPSAGAYGATSNPGGNGGFGILVGGAGGGGGKIPGVGGGGTGGWGGGGASGIRLPSGQVVAASSGGGVGGRGELCSGPDGAGGNAAYTSLDLTGTNGSAGCRSDSGAAGGAGGLTPNNRAVGSPTGGTSASTVRGGGGGGGGVGYFAGSGGHAGNYESGGGGGGGGWTYVSAVEVATVELDGYFKTDPLLYGTQLNVRDETKAAGIVIVTPLLIAS